MKTLYEAYVQDGVPIEEFGGPLSCRDHVPNEGVRVQSRKTGWRGSRGWTDNCRTRPSIGM